MSKYFGLPLATALLHLLNASASCCEPQVCYGGNGLRPIDPDNSTNNKIIDDFSVRFVELSTSAFLTTITTTDSTGMPVTTTFLTTTTSVLFLIQIL